MVLSYEEDIILFSLHSKTFKTFSEWSVIACNNSYSFFPFNLITFIVWSQEQVTKFPFFNWIWYDNESLPCSDITNSGSYVILLYIINVPSSEHEDKWPSFNINNLKTSKLCEWFDKIFLLKLCSIFFIMEIIKILSIGK